MNRLSACTLSFRMLSLDDALDELQSLGYTGVDLWQVSPYYDNKGHVASDAAPHMLKSIRKNIDDREMTLVNLASYPGMHFRKAHEQARQDDLAWARQTIDACAAMGIPMMRVLTGRGEDLDDLDRLLESLRETSSYAAQRDVTLLIETHHNNPTVKVDWITTIFDGVASDRLGLLYDPGNLGPDGAYKSIPIQCAARIHHVHLKNVTLDDSGTKAAGWADPDKGEIDFDWVLRALKDIGYRGALTVEYENFQSSCTIDQARAGLKAWKTFLADHGHT